VTPRHFVVATAGHVDHGKSALVKSLTGTDPDRLPEEKKRGITIDLGFAHLKTTGPNGEAMAIGFVDVPGHEDFVRNMIAGVGSVDIALLVVAADDGWMPQTEEHLQILLYLGVGRLIVAVTKADLGKAAAIELEVREKLLGTPFVHCPIIPTSVATGSGIPELKEAIMRELSQAELAANIAKPRLSIDRAFTLRGLGTVVTGTLAHGSIHRGQSVIVQPGNFASRIRSIQTYGRDVESAPPGARTALNLPDAGVGQSATDIKRGDIITALAGETASLIDVLVSVSARAVASNGKARPVRNRTTVDVHHGTSRGAAKVMLADVESLGPGRHGLARLRLEKPILAFAGDRLVLRDRSQQHTLAGGIVLDSPSQEHSFRAEAQQTLLRARAAPGTWNNPDVCVASEVVRDKIVSLPSLLGKSIFAAEAIAESVRRLEAKGQIKVLGSIAVDPAAWETFRSRAIDLIDQFHAEHPQLGGMDLSAFRAAFRDLSADALEMLVRDLNRSGFMRNGQSIARQAHRAALPMRLEAAAARIRQALAAKPFDPPARKAIVPDESTEQALRFLIREGSVAEISSEVILLRNELDKMTAGIRHFIAEHGPASASQIRQELKTSRRVVIPLLEYLDREGMTRRAGDLRTLRK
jgi:selenocysteine-specific elongation factor